MIIDSSQGKVEVIGDVKEFKSSIDPKNLEFITTLLSSNLYSNPEQSFIREIVSNAWDSHVEAGNTDTPVIIKFNTTYSNSSITIRDYGTGLSPERFNEVYRNIGSSTKRDSNEYIGAFGIGHLSPFACSSTVYVTSYYNGKAYYYVGTKVNNSITYHQLNVKPTEEKNGVEITIRNISNINRYIDALNYIIFFPNIYVTGLTDNRINDTKIKKFNNFAAASNNIYNKILLGNVLYPCDAIKLCTEARNFLMDLHYTNIVIKFDVGELNITPNRENIIYTTDTIKVIESRVLEAKKELHTMIADKLNKDYDNLEEYYNIISSTRDFDPITNSFTIGSYYQINTIQEDYLKITYKGQDIRDCINDLKLLYNSNLSNFQGFKGFVCENRISTKLSYINNCKSRLRTKNILLIDKNVRLIKPIQEYLKENYRDYTIITDAFTCDSLKSFIKDSNLELNNLAQDVYDSFINKAIKLDFDTDPDYKKFKEEWDNAGKTKTVSKDRDMIIYIRELYGFNKCKFSKFNAVISYIKNLRCGIVLSDMKADENLLYSLAKFKNFIYIRARKDIVDDIMKLNLKCIVDTDYYMYKDPIIPKLKTIYKYFPTGVSKLILNNIGKYIDNDLYNEFNNISKLANKFLSTEFSYRAFCLRDTIPYDSYTESICRKLVKYINEYNNVKNLVINYTKDIDLIATVLLKNKICRIKSDMYKEIKSNPLIKILCRK